MMPLAAGDAMSDNDPVAQLVAEFLRHLAAQRHIEHIAGRATLLKLDLPVLPVTIVAIEVFVGPDHPITAMAIAQRNRNGPEDGRVFLDLIVGLIAHVGRGRCPYETPCREATEATPRARLR